MKNHEMDNHETVLNALRYLGKCREEMIHLAAAGEMTSADFAEINALEKRLTDYADKTAPKHEPLSFAGLFSKTEGAEEE